MRTALLTVLGVALLSAALWIGGELHRQSCIKAGNLACSVLPWENGHGRYWVPNCRDYYTCWSGWVLTRAQALQRGGHWTNDPRAKSSGIDPFAKQ